MDFIHGHTELHKAVKEKFKGKSSKNKSLQKRELAAGLFITLILIFVLGLALGLALSAEAFSTAETILIVMVFYATSASCCGYYLHLKLNQAKADKVEETGPDAEVNSRFYETLKEASVNHVELDTNRPTSTVNAETTQVKRTDNLGNLFATNRDQEQASRSARSQWIDIRAVDPDQSIDEQVLEELRKELERQASSLWQLLGRAQELVADIEAFMYENIHSSNQNELKEVVFHKRYLVAFEERLSNVYNLLSSKDKDHLQMAQTLLKTSIPIPGDTLNTLIGSRQTAPLAADQWEEKLVSICKQLSETRSRVA